MPETHSPTGAHAMAHRSWRRHSWPWFGLALGLLGAGAAYLEGPLQGLRRVYFDRLRAYQQPAAVDDPSGDLALVAYDDDSARRYGIQIRRERLADLVDKVFAAGARVVAIDHTIDSADAPSAAVAEALEEIAQALPGQPGVGQVLSAVRLRHDATARLVKALDDKPAVGAFSALYTSNAGNAAFNSLPQRWSIESDDCEGLTKPRSLVLDLDAVQRALRWGGSVLLQADDDQVLRRYPLVTRIPADDCPGCVYPSLAVAAVAAFRGQDLKNAVFLHCNNGMVVYLSVGAEYLPVDPDGGVEINYSGTFAESFPNTVPAWTVLQGLVPPERLRDKLVFIGTRSVLLDYFRTPTEDRFPGVGIHMLLADSMLHRRWLKRPDRVRSMLEPLAFLGVGAVVTLVFLFFEDAYWPLLLWPAFPVAGHLISRALLARGYLVDAFFPGVVGSAAVLACAGARFYLERAARQTTERELGRFLSPQVVNVALRNPDLLLPMRREISILFSDIRDFTTVAERMEPETLRTFLNEYLTRMTQIVFQERGTLDKYIGDAMMVLFGAPIESKEHAQAACRAALNMIHALSWMQNEWRAKGQPVLEIGVGINTGTVSVGRIGSAGQSGYTALGDAVNFASRAEGLTKVYGVRILVGDRTRQVVGETFLFRDLGTVRVKGKHQAVRIHELLGPREAFPSSPAWLVPFEKGLAAFRARAWDEGERLFRETITARPGGDPPSQTFLDFIAGFRARPPAADWDGAIERQEK